ncbi:MAG: hypothetical protein ABR574_03245 [Cryomorphaceae bacterium]|nr:hypothetical protein [Flavobacteriales bacterium]
MIEITRDNYEAFFLDYIEGNLDAEAAEALDVFLSQNPDLKHELEDAEVLPLQNDNDSKRDWSDLKQAGDMDFYIHNPDSRDALFVKHIDGETSAAENAIVDEMLTQPELAAVYEEWKTMLLQPGNEETDKSALYGFASNQAVSHANFDDFLIAFAEGELDAKKVDELTAFAEGIPNGLRDMDLAQKLRLTPPQGVFFAGKESLYRREKRVIPLWFYRAAAVAAVVMLGVFAWNTSQYHDTLYAPRNSDLADRQPIDTTSAFEAQRNNAVPLDSAPDPEKRKVEKRDSEKSALPQSPEAGVQYAEDREDNKTSEGVERENHKVTPLDIKAPSFKVRSIEPLLAETSVTRIPEKRDVIIATKTDAVTYKTIGELSEEFLANRLEIDGRERDELALAVTKKVTQKAGNILDAEFEKIEKKGDETTSYKLRIGQFKVSHTKGN